jgi:hypothetical protein
MKYLFFIIALSLAASAQNNGTVAVLDFENKAVLKDLTMQRVTGKIREEFTAKHGYVALDRWLIDTMMGSQGNKQLLKCTDESCLFAIGHLLSVDLVVNGSITKVNRRYCISAELVDVKNNIAAGNAQTYAIDFYDTTVARASHELVNKLFELVNAKKAVPSSVAGNQPPGQKQDVLNNTTEEGNHHKRKPGLTKLFIWVPVAAVVLGGAAAGIYYLALKHAPASPPDNDISIDDAPKHPTSGVVSSPSPK